MGQIQANAAGCRALANDDVQRIVFHSRIEHFLYDPPKTMHLVDKEDVPSTQVGENGGEVTGALNGRPRGDLDAHPHLDCDDVGQSRLAQAGWAIKQGMIECLAPRGGRFETYLEILDDPLLANILI